MILRAYIDDSGLNQAPVLVLAGWIAPAGRWSNFADEWKAALEMKPLLRYFKMSEAMSLSGQFLGWSEDSRDFRIRYLANLIKEYGLIGVATVVPHDLYQEIFVGRTRKDFDVPYFLMFHGLMAGIVSEFSRVRRDIERIDFVFDDQPGQMARLPAEWIKFKNVAPPQYKRLLGDTPQFRNDKTTLPLQAADMHAWYVRILSIAEIASVPLPNAPWAPAGGVMDTVTWTWNRQALSDAFTAITNAERLNAPVEIWPRE